MKSLACWSQAPCRTLPCVPAGIRRTVTCCGSRCGTVRRARRARRWPCATRLSERTWKARFAKRSAACWTTWARAIESFRPRRGTPRALTRCLPAATPGATGGRHHMHEGCARESAERRPTVAKITPAMDERGNVIIEDPPHRALPLLEHAGSVDLADRPRVARLRLDRGGQP